MYVNSAAAIPAHFTGLP
ncbi:hypothetical protein PIIN_11245 [Serendipita indica DSM 11827]|uniref:Uncharacterized protein n=1 Tax=Serendipita indica (strain DSM 11827) TaxID=1109443 RepID=G4U124_SERID|nr:hypothetical protein PIIN_11245 [Serendipita indica DSM 11827]